MANIKPKLLILLITIILIFAVYLSYIGGYGSDEDTLPMIYVFERRLSDGSFVTSRFTGNPVAELGIGFLSYYFGSFVVNIITFLFFFSGIIFIYYSLSKNLDNNLYIFLLLCLSSHVLFFDNIEPIDYSWALLPFALGIFFLKKKLIELSVIFFAISVGVRLNYLIFILPVIYFYPYNYSISLTRKSIIFISIFFVSGLFYLPIWYDYSFSLEWLTSARPTEQGFPGLLARFIYKILVAFGILQFIVILSNIITSKILILNFYKQKLIFFLILLNLGLFLYIPAELSYLQPAIIILYFFVSKYFNSKLIYLIICLNFLTWIISFNFLEIEYKNQDVCKTREAISANFKLSIDKGAIQNFIDTRSMIECWAYDTYEERTKKILSGKALK